MDIGIEKRHDVGLLGQLKSRIDEVFQNQQSAGENCHALHSLLVELNELLDNIEIGEREWQDAFDAVQDPIFFHDRNNRIIRANKAYARQAGLDIRQVIGRPYFEVFPKSDGPLLQCACQLDDKRGGSHSEEITLDNGEIFWSRDFAMRNAQGDYIYTVHILENITEQRRLQRAVVENAERYRSLFDGVPDAIFLVDAESGFLLDANPAAERLIGRPRDEIITLHQSQLHPPGVSAIEDFTQQVQDELNGASLSPMEMPVLHVDGHQVLTEISSQLFRLDGKAVIQGVFRDITERKNAEENLNQAGQKLSLSLNLLTGVLQSVPIRVFWKDRDLTYLGCNTLFAEDAGLASSDDLIGKTDFDMGWKDQAEIYRDDDRRVMASGIPKLGYEEPQTTPNGSTIWLRTSKVPLRNDSREVIGILGIYDDITQQKQAEEDLQLSESRLKEAQEVAHLGSWELDLVKNDLWWSDENHRIFGIERGERNTYETFLSTIHPDDREFVNNAYTGSIENHTPYDIEHRLLMPDGSVKWVHERCNTYYADDGTPLRSAGTTLDITERHIGNELLRHSEAGLAEAQRLAHLGNWKFDIVNNVLTWSDEVFRIFEIEPQQFIGSYEGSFSAVHPDDREWVAYTYRESVKKKKPHDIVHRLMMPDGRIKYVRAMCETQYNEEGLPLCSIGTVQDVTEQHLTEQALNRSNRALKAISSCNSVLVHATDETELIKNMCQVIIDEGGYRLAWIGFVDDDEEKRVRPVAHAGINDGYLNYLDITYADTARGRGPTGSAVRCGQPQVVHDALCDPSFAPWRDAAAKYGYRSSLALPLKDNDNQVFAVLNIYAEEPNAFDDEALKLMQELSSDLAFGILALRTRNERDHYMQEHRKSDDRFKQVLVDTIRAMSLTLEKRDPYTAGHQNRVAQLSVAIGRELGMDEDRLEGLRLGATIHDIGKIYVPSEILNRPGRLSKAEFEIIKSHSEVGYEIIKDVQFPWPVADMVIQHHERIDGSGYPNGLSGDEIILEARILAVADVVEAISAHRPYRPAVGLDKALMEIEANRDRLYDGMVVDACLHLIHDLGFTFSDVTAS